MKYVTNHPGMFQSPSLTTTIGLMQALAGIISEVMCILFLASLNDTIEVLIRFAAFGSIAAVDNIYAMALPQIPSNRINNR